MSIKYTFFTIIFIIIIVLIFKGKKELFNPTSDCVDIDSKCDLYNENECVTNPTYMTTNCTKRCNMCGLTDNTYNAIISNANIVPSLVTGDCIDVSDKCYQYDCSDNQQFMSINCKKTCQYCDKTVKFAGKTIYEKNEIYAANQFNTGSGTGYGTLGSLDNPVHMTGHDSIRLSGIVHDSIRPYGIEHEIDNNVASTQQSMSQYDQIIIAIGFLMTQIMDIENQDCKTLQEQTISDITNYTSELEKTIRSLDLLNPISEEQLSALSTNINKLNLYYDSISGEFINKCTKSDYIIQELESPSNNESIIISTNAINNIQKIISSNKYNFKQIIMSLKNLIQRYINKLNQSANKQEVKDLLNALNNLVNTIVLLLN